MSAGHEACLQSAPVGGVKAAAWALPLHVMLDSVKGVILLGFTKFEFQ